MATVVFPVLVSPPPVTVAVNDHKWPDAVGAPPDVPAIPTLIGVRDDGVLLQPKTRLAVPVQVVPYAAIASLERRQGGGMGAAKAAAIGVAAGAGAFFTMLFITLAIVAD